MELVQAFNAELSTLYNVKPPISKAKMNSITKTAIKAIKMYKHIVQSVERFIIKCRPEYKVPGLYVVDSIVRQSRHQFGHDKDVFGPRFTRNFNQTFQNLFLTCPVEDRPKIVRVLNLWQRNNVFSCEVIQPLLDMANPNAELKTPLDDQQSKDDPDKNIFSQLQELASSLGISNNANISNLNTSSASNNVNNDNQIRFNKKLLDFDYGDDDDIMKGETPTESEPPLSTTIANSDDLTANPLALSMAKNLLSNPDLVQKLQQSIAMQSSDNGKMISNNLNEMAGSSFFGNTPNNLNNDLTEQLYNLRDSLIPNQNKSTNEFSNHHQFNQLNKLDNKQQYEKLESKNRRSISPSRNKYNYSSLSKQYSGSLRRDERSNYRDRNDKSRSGRDRRSSRERRLHRSRSRSPRISSSSNRDNKQQQQPTISTSVLSPESKEKERERERRKKGLPSIKKNYVTICSTTLWLGHLPKSITEIDISDAFGEYGTINTIDLISARGCAYVCMNRRQDAYRALQNLKNLKLHNSFIKMAWAPGKGMKGKEFKDYWDLELGVSYIPYDKISIDTDFELLEDGGMLDEESMPKSLLELRSKKLKEDKQQQSVDQSTTSTSPKTSNNLASAVVQPPIPPSKNQQQTPQTSQPTILPPAIPPIVSMASAFQTLPPPNIPHNMPHNIPLPGLVPPLPVGQPPHLIPPLPPHLGPPILHPPHLGHPPTSVPPPLINPPIPSLLPPLPVNKTNDEKLASTDLKSSQQSLNTSLNNINNQNLSSTPSKFSQPPISLNNNPTNNSPWIAGVPPTLQPFLNSNNDDPTSVFNNRPPPLFDTNPLLMNPQLQMNHLMSFDDGNLPQPQFNDNKFNKNWRDQLNNRNNRFSNNLDYEANYNDNSRSNKRIKRNDNFNFNNNKNLKGNPNRSNNPNNRGNNNNKRNNHKPNNNRNRTRDKRFNNRDGDKKNNELTKSEEHLNRENKEEMNQSLKDDLNSNEFANYQNKSSDEHENRTMNDRADESNRNEIKNSEFANEDQNKIKGTFRNTFRDAFNDAVNNEVNPQINDKKTGSNSFKDTNEDQIKNEKFESSNNNQLVEQNNENSTADVV